MIDARAVRSGDREGLRALFDAAACPCFCRYFHFDGDKNAWLMRCAEAPAENERELFEAIAQERDDGLGLVAHDRDRLVGWMKLAEARAVAKAYAQRVYQALPCLSGERSGVYFLACALVHPGHRREGVATALVGAALDVAVARGGRAVEAFPRRARERERGEELWTIPVEPLLHHGFRVVGGEDPYPVLRRELP